MSASPDPVPSKTWEIELHNFIVSRYARVQAAAQTWVSIMTTLFGVFSTVVVLSGPRTISQIHGGQGWRDSALAGAALVFLLAFLATVFGLRASWGGLGLLKQGDGKEGRWSPEGLTEDDIKKVTWQNYCNFTLEEANKRRKLLHQSRILGLSAVTAAGLLAFALILNSVVA